MTDYDDDDESFEECIEALKEDQLETPRLILRHFLEEDAESCFKNFLHDEGLKRFENDFYCETMEEARNVLDQISMDYDKWAMVKIDSGEVIGYIDFRDNVYEEISSAKIGYILGEKFQHKGYVTEALYDLIDEYFWNRTHFGNDYFYLEIQFNENNTASGRVAERLGFKIDGKLRNRRVDLETGEICNLVVTSLTREEWGKQDVK